MYKKPFVPALCHTADEEILREKIAKADIKASDILSSISPVQNSGIFSNYTADRHEKDIWIEVFSQFNF